MDNGTTEQILELIDALDVSGKRRILHSLQTSLASQTESIQDAVAAEKKENTFVNEWDEMAYIIADDKRVNWIEWGPYQVVVTLLEDIPALKLRRGQVGAVKQMVAPNMCDVEFIDVFGFAYATATLHVEQLMRLHFHLEGVDPNPSLRWAAARR